MHEVLVHLEKKVEDDKRGREKTRHVKARKKDRERPKNKDHHRAAGGRDHNNLIIPGFPMVNVLDEIRSGCPTCSSIIDTALRPVCEMKCAGICPWTYPNATWHQYSCI